MYIPSNILRMPSVLLFPDESDTVGADLKATFTNASLDSNYISFGLEQNTNYSINSLDTSIITVTKKTLVRATLRQKVWLSGYQPIQNQSYLYGIFDNTTNLQLGCQGGFGFLYASYPTPNGGGLNQYHNSADAILEANTSFYIKTVSVTPSGGGILPIASKIYLFQLEP